MSTRRIWFAHLGSLVLLLPLAGCLDGPFFQLKKLNPYIQNQWKADREKVVVFSERIDELRLLRTQIASMSDQEQSDWVTKLSDILKTETSPEIRRETVLVLDQIPNRPDALDALNPLSKDKNDKVRMALVAALRRRPDQQATNTLIAMSTSDPNNNVKLSATRALGSHKSEEVKQFLGSRLDDRNIAVRFQASQALGELTGRRYGGDIDAWRKYVAGESVPEPELSFAQTLESMFLLR
ncbi:MAG: HEAT repeat domain-containing protein [Pirellula sp.]